jgi:hypothetical protein
MSCRQCGTGFLHFSSPKWKSMDHYYSYHPICARCKADIQVYHYYAKKVLYQGRTDLQPAFEWTCERVNPGFHSKSLFSAEAYKCAGCGSWKGRVKKNIQ